MNDRNAAGVAIKGWLDENEGFGLRRERLHDELAASPERVLVWLEAAFLLGMEKTARETGLPRGQPIDEWLSDRRAWAESLRDFPANTCPASRHLELIAEALIETGSCLSMIEEPRHVAGSIYSTLGALWECRSGHDKTDGGDG